MPILVLVRGLPYSGKTTFAKANFVSLGFKHLETDMFFTKDGKYCYRPGKFPDAVDWCQRQALEIMKQGHDLVVSNHFIRLWELGFYLKLAENFGYEAIVHTLQSSYEASGKYPEKILNYMQEEFEQ